MHTHGPWLQSSTVLICDKDARVIANCTPLREIPELAIPLRDVDANARLIAAAPDLLAALEKCVKQLEIVLPVTGRVHDERQALIDAYAAINKAKLPPRPE